VRAEVHASEDQLVESSLNREADQQPASPDEPADHQTRVKTLQLEFDPLPDVETTVAESAMDNDRPNDDLQSGIRLPWSLEGYEKPKEKIRTLDSLSCCWKIMKKSLSGIRLRCNQKT
jgi:hypothetical protein